MKKPSVSKSKKGAIFNILWLLIENPKNLKYYRLLDIKEQLMEEFSINLDRKTIQDYMNILVELNLPLEISHAHKKGYYINNKMITNTERNILFNSLNSQKALNLESKIHLFNYLTFDCSKSEKNDYYNNNEYSIYSDSSINSHINLVENLEIIQKAIDEKRSITFEYLNYNKYGELMGDARRYEVIPQRIKYIYGMYYLYNADNFWANIYCGTKIKYMRNIKLGDYHHNPKLHEKFDYSFEVYILQEWSIELIADYFDDYKLIRDKNSIKAIINTPYEYALEWCKKYAQFFVIKDEEIKNAIRNDMKALLENIAEKDDLILKIKAAIVDYHYQNPILDNNSYSIYMTGLYKQINFYLNNMGYALSKSNVITTYNGCLDNINISYVECSKSNINYNEDKALKMISDSYYKLKSTTGKKIMVIFYDEFDELTKDKIVKTINYNPFNDIHDRFSECAASYFYKYLVFEIV